MASNSTVVSRSGYTNNDFDLIVSAVENSTNTSANTSNITVKAQLHSRTSVTAWSVGNPYPTLAIFWAGTQRAIINVPSIGAGTTVEATATFDVAHNSNGTGSGTARAVFTKNNSASAVPGSGEVSVSLTLTTIPRAATVTAAHQSIIIDASLGTANTMTFTGISGMTYKPSAKIGSTTIKTWSDITGAGSKSFTLTDSEILSKLSSKTGTVTVTLDTYSGSTKIGSSSTSFAVTIDNSSVHPTVAISSVAVTNGYSGRAYAGRSYLTVNTSVTAASGASAVTTTVTVSSTGPSVTMRERSSSEATAAFRTATVGASSSNYTLTFTVTATDSRGATDTKTRTVTVYGWTAPSASIDSGYRTADDTSTSQDAGGPYVYFEFSGTKFSSGGTVTGEYRIGTGSWQSVSSGSHLAVPIDSTATLRVTVTDAIGVSSIKTKEISTALLPLDLYSNSTGTLVGAGIGAAAQSNRFNIGLPTFSTKNIILGESKTGWSDANAGLYLGTDGTIHLTHETSGSYIGFHYQKSTAATSFIEEIVSGALELGVTDGVYVGKSALSDGESGVVLGKTGNIYSYANAAGYPTLIFRRKTDNSNIAYVQVSEAANTLTLVASGGVTVNNDFNAKGALNRNGKPVAFSDTTNTIHFKWVSGTGLEVYVDTTKVATI